MCGIAGEINLRYSVAKQNYHAEMLSSLSRRGPDGNGIFEDKHGILLHSRLAVIDIQNGGQPMTAKYDGASYTICYNGELYNTAELKSKLKAEGLTFETKTDTEVVLKAYILWGEKALSLFNGIFAFAIFCPNRNELFVARDKMGVKPFFYAERKGSFIFASELKTLLCHPDIEPEINFEGISELLFLGPGRTPGSGVFKDVFELKPGFYGKFTEDGFTQTRYFSLVDTKNEESPEEIIKNVRYLVTDSIEKQLVSDVPVGTFLSGGLDSSIISSVAARHFAKKANGLKPFR